MYTLEAVTKTYARRGRTVTALDTTDLEIATGEFVAVVGPSGSGKTTLLSLLGGMLAPTSGRVLLDGQSLYELSVEERTVLRGRMIGFVFQSFNLIPWLSACENVQVPLMLAGQSVERQQQQARDMLERVGLADRIDHRPAELSQGQQQRVALARTLANDPDVILADEPTGNLDSETGQQVLEYLTQFHQDGRTIVMVTHDAAAADSAQRKIRLKSGVAEEVSLSGAA
jgi:putative ABC transport system ATP-binding protein